MAQGNILDLIRLISLILFLFLPSVCCVNTTLNSGLLFDRFTHQEIPINGRKLSLHRKISMEPMDNTLAILEHATEQFENFCKSVTASVATKNESYYRILSDRGLTANQFEKETFEVRLGANEYIRNADSSCKKIFGKLFEIRNEKDYSLAPRDLPIVPANTFFDFQAQRVKYLSDGAEPATSTYRFAGYKDNTGRKCSSDDYWFLEQAKTAKIQFLFNHEGVWLQVMTTKEMNMQLPIPCKVQVDPIPMDKIPGSIDRMMISECQRDSKQHQQSFLTLRDMLRSTFKGSNLKPAEPSRQKRLAPMAAIALGTGASAEESMWRLWRLASGRVEASPGDSTVASKAGICVRMSDLCAFTVCGCSIG